MSLVAHALAICAAGALVEALPSWIEVRLEPHEPIGAVESAGSVLVAVFVGDETMNVQGRKWSHGSQVVELVVQVILPPKIVAVLGDARCEFDTAAGGTRALYALVHEGLRRAFTTPGTGTWGALLQAVWVGHPDALHGMPGKAERPGKLPVPVIDYSIPCSTIMPPPPGQPAPYPWPDIAAKMRADDAFTDAEADFFEALVVGEPLSGLLAELALAGLSRREGVALGLGPLQDVDPASILTETDLDSPNGLTVTVAGGDGP